MKNLCAAITKYTCTGYQIMFSCLSSETNRKNMEQAQKMQQMEDRVMSLERCFCCEVLKTMIKLTILL